LKIAGTFGRGENESLERIGCVLHVSSTKNMILKAENLPHVGDKVVDETLKQVGTVFDVFGPVSSPYVAVRPSVEEPNLFVDHVLYAVPSFELRREKRRR
jgi:RNA-binding protein